MEDLEKKGLLDGRYLVIFIVQDVFKPEQKYTLFTGKLIEVKGHIY